MSRHYCPHCSYPLTACLCDHVQPIQPQTQLVVLQHPSEVEHKKNSVKVLSLVIPNTQVYVGETEADFALLRGQLMDCGRPVYLVYPSELSVSVEQQRLNTDCVLLLIDGTWRKAFKILQLNSWLAQLPAVHLAEGYASRYKIRKSSRSDSLSTLEASAYMLKALEPDLDVSPLLNAFDAMVELRIRSMPAQVRLRYQNGE
ncbi:tRNA-uridine aminocarboxypropyltransferase [Shewanella mangrovisoli]|uniref:tRNA-uridine aminocarboxypropyltransferase n=1 Tax=Shewanella mangrovisoli TaxID=2864211 RepID=UPI0035BA4B4A